MQALAGVALGSEHHVVEHAHRREDARELESAHDAAPGDAVAGEAVDAAALETHGAEIGPVVAADFSGGRAASVRLPAPLGPMSAVIESGGATAKVAAVGAARQATEALGHVAHDEDRLASFRRRRHVRNCISALAPSSPCGRNMLRADEDEADDDESERPRLARGQRQVEEAQALGQRTKESRTNDDAAVARETAKDQYGVAEEGEARIELAWVEIGDVHGEEEAGDRRQRRRDAEGLQLEAENVLAKFAAVTSSSSRIALSTRPQGLS